MGRRKGWRAAKSPPIQNWLPPERSERHEACRGPGLARVPGAPPLPPSRPRFAKNAGAIPSSPSPEKVVSDPSPSKGTGQAPPASQVAPVGAPGSPASLLLERLSALASSFPSLRGKPGTKPFNGARLDDWAVHLDEDTCGISSARFVLAVYDSRATWKAGAFDLFAAVKAWDRLHRRAFAEWAAAPWMRAD